MIETIGVLGGAGMIGSHVAKQLLERGHKVIVYDNHSAYPVSQTKHFFIPPHHKLKVVNGDILQYRTLSSTIQKCDRIVQMVSLADVGACVRDPFLNFKIDMEGNRNVLKACLQHNVKKLVFASSASVYGNPKWSWGKPPKVKETDAVLPPSPYANTKLFNEQQYRLFSELYDFPTTSLRYFSVWGEGQTPKKGSHSWCIPIFAMKLMKNKPITVFGDGKQVRDFTHINDITRATVESLFDNRTDGKVINVGTGKPTTINTVAEKIHDSLGFPKESRKIQYQPLLKGDPLGCYADNSLMRKTLGWVPKYSFQEGVGHYLEWLKKKKNTIPRWI